jgi:hypothetical protein
MPVSRQTGHIFNIGTSGSALQAASAPRPGRARTPEGNLDGSVDVDSIQNDRLRREAGSRWIAEATP